MPTQINRTNHSRVSPEAALILVDCTQKPLYYSSEAIKVLSYPQHLKNPASVMNLLPLEIHSWLLCHPSLNNSSCLAEFISGRRHYVCRAFRCVHNSERPSNVVTALLIERSEPKCMNFSELAEQFHFTPREQEAVVLLTLGLTGKEIASRMGVTPGTVKAFLRLVMAKMAVRTRTGIVGKIVRM
jgi:DNA-binding CsgD family transcriptional regulator